MDSITVKGKKVSSELREDPSLATFCQEELGNHPLSVSLAARALCGRDYNDATKYIRSFVRQPQLEGSDPRHVRGMRGVLGLALARMEQEIGDQEACSRSKALLCVLSVLPSRAVPLQLFEDGCEGRPYWKLFTPAGVADALSPLLSEGLVRQQIDGSLEIHSMVQHSARALLKDGPEGTALDTLGGIFAERFVAPSSRRRNRALVG